MSGFKKIDSEDVGKITAIEFTITFKPKVKTKYINGICSEHVRIEL